MDLYPYYLGLSSIFLHFLEALLLNAKRYKYPFDSIEEDYLVFNVSFR